MNIGNDWVRIRLPLEGPLYKRTIVVVLMALALAIIGSFSSIISNSFGREPAYAQTSPTISVDLSSNSVPQDVAITGDVTLNNLDSASYSSVIFRADITAHDGSHVGCKGDDTGIDIAKPASGSRLTFVIDVFDACAAYGYGNYTLEVKLYPAGKSPNQQRTALASTSVRFTFSRYMAANDPTSTPPSSTALGWLDPEPTSIQMKVGEWYRFVNRFNPLNYWEDHVNWIVNAEMEGQFASHGGESPSTPSSTFEEACGGIWKDSWGWRRANNQGLWIMPCIAGDARFLVTGEVDSEWLADYQFTVDANDDFAITSIPTPTASATSTRSSVTVIVTVPQTNTPATGAPTITGTAQVGQTLTASTSGIADADLLTNVSYSYQWLADDTEIEGATSSTYTLQGSDNGKAIKVRVTFTDDAGNEESLTSAATNSVTASVSSYDANENGVIEKNEVIAAINDYLDDRITKDELIAVIKLYLSG